MLFESSTGKSYPLGASPCKSGVNFSVYANRADQMELLLFERAGDAKPEQVIRLNPAQHRTYHYWHVCVQGLKLGQIYAYRAYGPFLPEHGLRYDPKKVLLDPYSRAVAVPPNYSRIAASRPGDNTATAMKSVVVDTSLYDWEGDLPLHRPFSETVIYEMHVKGFTRHPNSGVAEPKRGTYAGVIEKIPYLLDLGITAVELLPIFQYDDQDAPNGLTNYWGYTPVSFFAPHAGYSAAGDPGAVLDEFRDMVKALHSAGIEVILDVVFNHTAEGDVDGPTLSLRGLANDVYYMLDPADKSEYADYTGTGNTLNANYAVVRRMILDSLQYWVREMHVDGFRFDLASILARDEFGQPLANPPVLWDIDSDPELAGTKLIAEAWDAAGLYQVGSFVGESWKEWNGKFRDDVRSFVRGDNGTVRRLAQRLLGSPDLYGHEEREPEQSINFITSHDGFTLNDLVSYNRKHNLANGEGNQDGENYNLSWNHGVEGPTADPEIEILRNRQVKNFFALTLLAVGAPMLLMGDEMRRTQMGNNNAYCQDNEISWLDWSLLEKHVDIHRFVRQLINLRMHMHGPRVSGVTLNQLVRWARVQYHGVKLYQPDDGYYSHTLAFSVRTARASMLLHVLINAYQEALDFELPLLGPRYPQGWQICIDTYHPAPLDIYDWDTGPSLKNGVYNVHPYSLVVLAAHQQENGGNG